MIERRRAAEPPTAEAKAPAGCPPGDRGDPSVEQVLALQRGAGNAAVARYLHARGDGERAVSRAVKPPPRAPRAKRTQNTEGVILRTGGMPLLRGPTPRAKRIGHLAYGTRVYVDDAQAGGGTSHVTTADGREGFVEASVVRTNLPCPGARLHYVRDGELAIDLAKQYFRDQVKSGRDRRYYVNVLAYCNPRALVDPDVRSGGRVMFKATFSIWIPTAEFANSLRGRVPDGSITNGLWSKGWKAARGVIDKAVGLAIGAPAFVFGLLKGVVLEVGDVLAGLGGLIGDVVSVIKKTFRGTIIKDVRRLWKEISALDVKAVMGGLWKRFKGSWNAKSPWDRWSFRGEVVGRVLTEALLIYLTAGVSAILSGTSKFGRLTAAVSRLGSVQRLEQGVRTNSHRIRARLAQLRTKVRHKRTDRNKDVERKSRQRNAKKPGSGTPRVLAISGQLKRFNREQRKLCKAHIAQARRDGAYDIRVDQTQVGAAPQGRFAPRLGNNRPDLQYTDARGRRHIVEYDSYGSGRGIEHLRAALANDPSAVVELWQQIRVRRSGKLVKQYVKVFP